MEFQLDTPTWSTVDHRLCDVVGDIGSLHAGHGATPTTATLAFLRELSNHFVLAMYYHGGKRPRDHSGHVDLGVVCLADPTYIIASRRFPYEVRRHDNTPAGDALCRAFADSDPVWPGHYKFRFEYGGQMLLLDTEQTLSYWLNNVDGTQIFGRRFFDTDDGKNMSVPGGQTLVAAIAEWHAKYGTH